MIVSLCDKTGNMLKPWADAGHRCVAVDVQHSIRKDRHSNGIDFVWGDCRSWTPDGNVEMLFAFPPCTHLAGSGSRDWQKKDWPMLRDGMDLFHACLTAAKWAGCPFMIENPVGRISGLHGKPGHIFNPCDFGGYLDPPGDAYTKKTCLWTGGGFVMPERRPVEPVEGSRMHLMTPGPGRADARSETPMGFASAVFEANSRT